MVWANDAPYFQDPLLKAAERLPGAEARIQSHDRNLRPLLGFLVMFCEFGAPWGGKPFLHEQVRIDAAKTKGADRGAPGYAFAPAEPGHTLGQDAERAVVEVHAGLGGAEIGGRRQHLLFHGEEHLCQGRGAGRGQQMADIGFDGAENAGGANGAAVAPEFAQAGNLRGVPHRGAGGMAFDQVHILRFPPGPGVSGAHGA